MSIRSMLVQRGSFQQSTITRSDTGEEDDTWVTRQDQVPVLLRFARSASDTTPAVASLIDHVVYAEPNTAWLTGRWRVVIEGTAYLVVSCIDEAHRGHHYKILVRRLD